MIRPVASIRGGEARLGAARLGSACRIGGTWPGSARRIGGTWPGSARLGSARLGLSLWMESPRRCPMCVGLSPRWGSARVGWSQRKEPTKRVRLGQARRSGKSRYGSTCHSGSGRFDVVRHVATVWLGTARRIGAFSLRLCTSVPCHSCSFDLLVATSFLRTSIPAW
jgi:hypothetical protein